jgi:hypothetical protein
MTLASFLTVLVEDESIAITDQRGGEYLTEADEELDDRPLSSK